MRTLLEIITILSTGFHESIRLIVFDVSSCNKLRQVSLIEGVITSFVSTKYEDETAGPCPGLTKGGGGSLICGGGGGGVTHSKVSIRVVFAVHFEITEKGSARPLFIRQIYTRLFLFTKAVSNGLSPYRITDLIWSYSRMNHHVLR